MRSPGLKVTKIAALAFGATLLLSSCANPVEAMLTKGVESAVSKATGGDISIGLNGSAKLPKDWPSVPTPKTAPSFAAKVEGAYTAGFLLPKGEVQKILTLLEKSGYEETTNADMGEATFLNFDNGVYSVSIAIVEEEDGNTLLSYSILESSK